MSGTLVWPTLYLGNAGAMEPGESPDAGQTASPLLTTFGGGHAAALSNNIVDVTTRSGGREGRDRHEAREDEDERNEGAGRHGHGRDRNEHDNEAARGHHGRDGESGGHGRGHAGHHHGHEGDHGDDTSDTKGDSDTVSYDLGDGPVTALIDDALAVHGSVTFHDGSTFSDTFGVFQADNGDMFMMVLDSQPELASQGVASVTFDSVVGSAFTETEHDEEDDHAFVCFGPGTRIETPLGPVRADKLRAGDHVVTLDDGPQPIRWIGKRRLTFDAPHPAQPIRIAPGAFGPGLPRRALMLSPNHRVLLKTVPSYALHDPLGALAPAKALTRQPGIRAATGRRAITYFSFLLPMHAVILAEGVAVESLYPGRESWAVLDGGERGAWLRLAAGARVTGAPPARLLLSTAEARAGLEAAAMALPEVSPMPLSWRKRPRTRPWPAHLAAG